MSAFLAPVFGAGYQAFTDAGVVLAGGLLYTYQAGSTTNQATYTDSTQVTPNANPIVLGSNGRPSNEIWLQSGQSYKFVLKDSSGNTLGTWDNVSGINDVTTSQSEWSSTGLTPTYISGTQFSVSGNQTSAFSVGRRVQATITAGSYYGYISASSFGGGVTTVTCVADSSPLDSGLSVVNLGLQGTPNLSAPEQLVRTTQSTIGNITFGTGFYPALPATAAPAQVAQNLLSGICEGRLTLTSGSPVTTGDVTGATSVYFSPYVGNRVSLYDGTNWNLFTFSELTLALGTVTSGLPYDVFIYNNSGTPTLEALAWSSGTARATALALQNGVYVKSGTTTRRYLGTFYTTSTTATEDSAKNRYLWNYYNRVNRALQNTFTADRASTSTTYTEINTEIRLGSVIGVSEDASNWSFSGSALAGTGGGSQAAAIAFDSTTSQESSMQNLTFTGSSSVDLNMGVSGIKAPLAVGVHYTTVLEKSSAGSLTFRSADAAGTAKCYLSGTIRG